MHFWAVGVRRLHLLFVAEVEKTFGCVEGLVKKVLGEAMVGNVDEADAAAGVCELFCYGELLYFGGTCESGEVDHGDGGGCGWGLADGAHCPRPSYWMIDAYTFRPLWESSVSIQQLKVTAGLQLGVCPLV